jgi:DNA-binding CsgD family transcriptional regulator
MELSELDDIARGRYLMIHGTAEAFSGEIGAMAGVPAICVVAADAFSANAPERARDALLIAFERANSAEWMTAGTSLTEIAERASNLGRNGETSLPDRVLAALTALVRQPIADAMPSIGVAIDALRSEDAADDDIVRFGSLGVILTTAIWDDTARHDILTRVAAVARKTGALHALDSILFILSVSETVLGQLDSAAEFLAELKRLRDDLGMTPAQQEMFKNIEYLAWRGDDATLLADIEASSQAAMALGLGAAQTLARTALMILEICHCNYEAAYQIAQHNHDLHHMQVSIRVLPDLVEAAVRSGRIEQAREAAAELDTVATASGTHWGMGVLERSRAVLAENSDPEPHYAAAIEHLSACRAQGDLARTHLLYGEWLRRRKRRTDSRTQLRAALEQFQQMGAASFADRAPRELGIIGGNGEHQEEFPWRPAGLTPQESAVADLAVDGATNGEIAAALMISRHTVDYHLRKVFRKLGISSRRELAGMRRTTSKRP